MDASQISSDCEVVTPSDSNDCNAVGFIFSGGDCAVVTARGATRIIPAAFAGVLHPQAIRKVLATGTTATTILVYRG